MNQRVAAEVECISYNRTFIYTLKRAHIGV